MTKCFEESLTDGWVIQVGYLFEKNTKKELNQKPPKISIMISFVPSGTGEHCVVSLSTIELIDGMGRPWELDDDSRCSMGAPICLGENKVDVEIACILSGTDRIEDDEACLVVDNLTFAPELDVDGNAVRKSLSFVRGGLGNSASPLEWK